MRGGGGGGGGGGGAESHSLPLAAVTAVTSGSLMSHLPLPPTVSPTFLHVAPAC